MLTVAGSMIFDYAYDNWDEITGWTGGTAPVGLPTPINDTVILLGDKNDETKAIC